MMQRPDHRGMLNMKIAGSLFETKNIITSPAGSSTTYIGGVAQQPVITGLRGLIPVRQVSSGTVAFLQQATRSGAKATVQAHEGDVKSELTITVSLKTAPVATVAGWTRASKQILDDLDSFMNFLDNELLAAVLEAETTLILSGDSTNAGQFDGLLKLATAYTDSGAGTGDTSLDVLLRARTALGANNVVPNGLVLHPSDAGGIAGLKTAQGEYLVVTATPAYSGLTIVSTTAMTAGTFLLGDFASGAEIEEREAPNVQISSEDADNFTKNLLTVRGEQRLSLSVFKPWCFSTGSLTPVTMFERSTNGGTTVEHAKAGKK
jgi:HK97 family phage major capsid protein